MVSCSASEEPVCCTATRFWLMTVCCCNTSTREVLLKVPRSQRQSSRRATCPFQTLEDSESTPSETRKHTLRISIARSSSRLHCCRGSRRSVRQWSLLCRVGRGEELPDVSVLPAKDPIRRYAEQEGGIDEFLSAVDFERRVLAAHDEGAFAVGVGFAGTKSE